MNEKKSKDEVQLHYYPGTEMTSNWGNIKPATINQSIELNSPDHATDFVQLPVATASSCKNPGMLESGIPACRDNLETIFSY